ncbi:MAG TPA: type II toxin-antitoxin system prevent-host-death family antitoxin [Thermoanaerobaculia bacterium]|jgi:prevent-host-death family protein|nr:type II toxin-antitoxin system prevent-host-death family antitoxin [Thermoanaerobaculia bacterium]
MRTTVGARELKTRLGTYLRKVRRGATLVVTDRGEPIAELRPLGGNGSHDEAGLAVLAAMGVVTRGEKAKVRAFRPIVSSGPAASEAVIEGREDRF